MYRCREATAQVNLSPNSQWTSGLSKNSSQDAELQLYPMSTLVISPSQIFFLSLSPHYKHMVSTGRTHQTYLSRCHFNDDTAQTPDVCSPAVTTLVVLCDDLWGHVGCKRKQHCNTLKLPQNCFFKDLYVSICGWSRGGRGGAHGCVWVHIWLIMPEWLMVTNGVTNMWCQTS